MESRPKAHGINDLRVEIVTTQEQMLHTLAVRAICFMEEHGYSAYQTFDGNDFQATHINVYANGEPVGSARLRWFRDFAKMERTSFRKAWRGGEILRRCSDFVFDHVARKGYDRLITHAQPGYARVWRRYLGFELVDGKEPLLFDGHGEPYVELVKHLDVPSNAITTDAPMSTLFRIEGQWDEPSQFEARS
ncbi:GNAT family N-acetyltransferase [Consotaella salsifontis]|uniref:N-acetyltransferase domain-containing protein n=1 Tax=Consotaella salsifontis TaxID=1365950 RepID=A0A1T4P7Y2_9HYPH|nr:hypothetical protein [Consotaella salsifontis]SJZ87685.1 hypothetical protein SAMN05428963_103387 [Consotaella salsifontis]